MSSGFAEAASSRKAAMVAGSCEASVSAAGAAQERAAASAIGRYPVQRHRLPVSASQVSVRSGLSPCLYSANKDMMKPGVQ